MFTNPLKGTGTNPIESNNIVVTVFCVVFDGKATRARPLLRRLFAKKSSWKTHKYRGLFPYLVVQVGL